MESARAASTAECQPAGPIPPPVTTPPPPGTSAVRFPPSWPARGAPLSHVLTGS
jgi:hypothetical protein